MDAASSLPALFPPGRVPERPMVKINRDRVPQMLDATETILACVRGGPGWIDMSDTAGSGWVRMSTLRRQTPYLNSRERFLILDKMVKQGFLEVGEDVHRRISYRATPHALRPVTRRVS